MCSLSMARDWLVSWVTFSSTVMRCTRSAARCSAGNAGFRYGGGSEFWAGAGLAIRRATVTARILKFDDRMYECASIRFLQIRRFKDRFRWSRLSAGSLKEPWRKVLKVAAPRLPLVIGPGGFVEDVLNVCFEQRGVQPLKACAHTLRLGCPHSDPQQMHFLCERGRICKHAAVVCFGIQLPVSKHEHGLCSAESSDVG